MTAVRDKWPSHDRTRLIGPLAHVMLLPHVTLRRPQCHIRTVHVTHNAKGAAIAAPSSVSRGVRTSLLLGAFPASLGEINLRLVPAEMNLLGVDPGFRGGKLVLVRNRLEILLELFNLAA